MNEIDVTDVSAAQERIRTQAQAGNIRVTVHAQQEMVDENISLDQVLQTITTGQILENYPHHRRGACCLVSGATQHGRPLHVVCTTAQPVLIII
jgi:hypothetical protein